MRFYSNVFWTRVYTAMFLVPTGLVVYSSLREISRTSELLLSYVNLGVEEVLRECARYLKACLPEE